MKKFVAVTGAIAITMSLFSGVTFAEGKGQDKGKPRKEKISWEVKADNDLSNNYAISFEEGVDIKAIVEGVGGNLSYEGNYLHVARADLTKEQAKLVKKAKGIKNIDTDGGNNKDKLLGDSLTGYNTANHSPEITNWGTRMYSKGTGFGGKGVKIAMIDTGIINHPDLNFAGTFNAIDGTSDATDDTHGHGTATAGVINAQPSGYGTIGVAPEAQVYAIKVWTDNGNIADAWVTAIDWAVGNGIDIVSTSQSGLPLSAYRDGVAEAYNTHGVLTTAASGNDGKDTINLYCQEPAICVAATDNGTTKASYSSWSTQTSYAIDFIAPSDLATTVDPATHTLGAYYYDDMIGTSFASPYVAGVLALYMAEYPLLTGQQILSKAKSDADFISGVLAEQQGSGLIDHPSANYGNDPYGRDIYYHGLDPYAGITRPSTVVTGSTITLNNRVEDNPAIVTLTSNKRPHQRKFENVQVDMKIWKVRAASLGGDYVTKTIPTQYTGTNGRVDYSLVIGSTYPAGDYYVTHDYTFTDPAYGSGAPKQTYTAQKKTYFTKQ